MKHEFEMSMFGEIKLFVGLQVNQLKHGIFVTQSKYIKEILKTFGLEDSKPSAHQWQQDTSYPRMMNLLKSTR